MADPHTDDLPDRPAQVLNDAVHRVLGPDAGTAGPYLIAALDAADYEVAAAAELRRLRDRDAALTRLLDAVGEGACKGVLDCWTPITHDAYGDGTPVERECGDCPPCRVAAAVEGIDQEHER